MSLLKALSMYGRLLADQSFLGFFRRNQAITGVHLDRYVESGEAQRAWILEHERLGRIHSGSPIPHAS